MKWRESQVTEEEKVTKEELVYNQLLLSYLVKWKQLTKLLTEKAEKRTEMNG